MPTYDVLTEYGVSSDSQLDLLSLDPNWVVCVLRTKFPTTYNRADGTSFSTLYEDAVRIRGKPLVITGDCISLTTAASKATHLTQMQATVVPGEVNYQAEIMAGDYVFAWMTNSADTAAEVVARINKNLNANRFLDGLKFVGRVHSLRKQIVQDRSGIRQTRYNINGVGFSEFDATLFYEPHLAEQFPAIGQTFARIGAAINLLVSQQKQGIDVNKAVLIFLDLLLGKGVASNFGLPGGDDRVQQTAGLEAPYAYILPAQVGTILAKTKKTKTGGVLSAADVIEFLYGIQHYSDSEIFDDVSEAGQSQGRMFQPKGTKLHGNRRFTGTDMLGSFQVTPPQFTDKSVWSILNQYLNPAVNEMYTCLRVNPEGLIVPTLIMRQLPFTSSLLQTNLEVTRFLELPRWKIHPIMVKSADIGRSESARINFVHVYGDSGPDKTAPFSSQIVRNPPVRDDLDIARSGLRPHMMTVSCSPTDIKKNAAHDWMQILSDILIGQHMVLTGTLELCGVTAPICPGDNIEWDDIVFHIEAVTHRCQISAQGQKEFSTTLALTHGVSARPGADDLSLFAGVTESDQRQYEAGLTQESGNPVVDEKVPARTGAEEVSGLQTDKTGLV